MKEFLNKVFLGNNIDLLKQLPDDSIEGVVTDPPYGLSKEPDIVEVMTHWINDKEYKHDGKGFMQKSWDSFVPNPNVWKEVFRVLKPGAYCCVFAGTRTVDLMGISLRFAGFEIRDILMWTFGVGFPKSLNISKAIDQQAGVERCIVGKKGSMPIQTSGRINAEASIKGSFDRIDNLITISNTEQGKKYEGYGTALKPSLEPIILCRKPLGESTVALNVLKHGTGGLNIDGCRIEMQEQDRIDYILKRKSFEGVTDRKCGATFKKCASPLLSPDEFISNSTKGRYPANLIHDGSDEVVSLFPNSVSSGGSGEKSMGGLGKSIYGKYLNNVKCANHGGLGDSGTAARFFYSAKVCKGEREIGLHDLEPQKVNDGREKDIDNAYQRGVTLRANVHPTVKPIELIRYLVRLIKPPVDNATIIDPFIGSGTTGCACILENANYIGAEISDEYINIANKRISWIQKHKEHVLKNGLQKTINKYSKVESEQELVQKPSEDKKEFFI